MTIEEEWEEACSWVYSTSIDTDNVEHQYIFFIDKAILCYYNVQTPEKVIKWTNIRELSPAILNQYIKVRRSTPFVGPTQPPPSPIIAKIRAMTKRRQEIGYAF